MPAKKTKKKTTKKKRGDLSEGLVPYYTGKSTEEILPKGVLKAGEMVKEGFSKIYPTVKGRKKTKAKPRKR